MAKLAGVVAERRAFAPPNCVQPEQALATALATAWSRDTSYDPWGWTASNAAWGQCAVTALVVQDRCGGQLLCGEVNGLKHYWNRLPDGEEIDLTATQFGTHVVRTPTHFCDRSFVLSYPDTVRRYRRLRGRVSSKMIPTRVPTSSQVAS
jgi:hypothetical protein